MPGSVLSALRVPCTQTPGMPSRTRRTKLSFSARTRALSSLILATAASSAAAVPHAPATSEVPPLRPLSCSPPECSASRRTPSFTYSAPKPFGPPNLCAERESMSHPSALTSRGMLPAACTASVWKSAPHECAMSASSRTGWMLPVSLFAVMTLTRTTSSPTASARLCGRTKPSPSTGSTERGYPSISSCRALS